MEKELFDLILGHCKQLSSKIEDILMKEVSYLFENYQSIAYIKFIGNGLWLFDDKNQEIEFLDQKHFTKNEIVKKLQEIRYIPLIGDLIPNQITRHARVL